MKSTTIVIPSYWGSPEKSRDVEEEIIFDHPTPLNNEGTLGRLLDSFDALDAKEFRIVIVTVTSSPPLTNNVIARMQEITQPYTARYDITLLHSQNLDRLRRSLIHDDVSAAACELINLGNYAAVRNMCSLAGILNGSEITVFLDDDEVITDSEFLSKAQEFIGTEYQGELIKAVAGYYLQTDSYRLDVSRVPLWRKPYWNNAAAMNQAFEFTIGRSPRLKPTPFVFGGNMTVHRDILMKVPFDPLITRGEDIDFLINLRINRITFWLDRELYIKHLPPKVFRPAWKTLRQDIKRFLYERKKVIDHGGIEGVSQKELMPYPGMFLGSDLEERIIRTNELLKKEYKKLRDEQGMYECHKNIELVKNNPFKDIDTPAWLKDLTTKWQELARAALCRGIAE
ncbi:hypothetical protein ES702_07773 [subsurface metagenome]